MTPQPKQGAAPAGGAWSDHWHVWAPAPDGMWRPWTVRTRLRGPCRVDATRAESVDVVSDREGQVWALLTFRPYRDGAAPIGDAFNPAAGVLVGLRTSECRYVAGPVDVSSYPIAYGHDATEREAQAWRDAGMHVASVCAPRSGAVARVSVAAALSEGDGWTCRAPDHVGACQQPHASDGFATLYVAFHRSEADRYILVTEAAGALSAHPVQP